MSKLKVSLITLIIVGLLLMSGVSAFAYREIDGEKHIIWGARQPVEILDPSMYYDWSTRTIQEATYDALLKYVGEELEPWLAESYEANDKGDVWTFHLVENAEFHNGDPVNAEAVKYSFIRTLELGEGPSWTLEDYLKPEGVEVVDEYTVRFNLTDPFAPFASYVPWWYIMNPNQVQANEVDGDYGREWMRDNTAGSGPFQIREWETGEYYWLEAWEDYWKGWPHPDHIDGFIFRLVREPASQRLGIQQGDLDIAAGVTPEDFGLLEEHPDIYVSENPGATTFGLKMNTQKGYTANPMIRKAISYAVNYQAFIDIYDGHAILMDSPFTPSTTFYTSMEDQAEDWPYRQDIEKAREFMRKAGYPDGGFSLEYVYVAGFEEEESMGLMLQDSLSRIGIDVKMIPLPWPQMVERGSDVETSPDLMAVFTTPLTLDADAVAFQYHPSSWGKYYGSSHYDNPRVAEFIEQARRTTDEEERAELYDQIQRMIYYDAPEIFGMLENRRWAFQNHVQGFVFSPVRMTNEIDMYTLYIDED